MRWLRISTPVLRAEVLRFAAGSIWLPAAQG